MPAFAVLALYIPLIFIGVKNAKLSRKQNIILGMTFILCIISALAWYMSIKNINGNVSYYGAKNIDQSKQFAGVVSSSAKNRSEYSLRILQISHSLIFS